MGPTLCVCPGGSGAIVRIEGEIDVCVADRVQQLLLRIEPQITDPDAIGVAVKDGAVIGKVHAGVQNGWVSTRATSASRHLTKNRPPHPGAAELLFDRLEGDGATWITLGPLDAEAQIALIGDVLGAVPDATLIQLAADAAGTFHARRGLPRAVGR